MQTTITVSAGPSHNPPPPLITNAKMVGKKMKIRIWLPQKNATIQNRRQDEIPTYDKKIAAKKIDWYMNQLVRNKFNLVLAMPSMTSLTLINWN